MRISAIHTYNTRDAEGYKRKEKVKVSNTYMNYY